MQANSSKRTHVVTCKILVVRAAVPHLQQWNIYAGPVARSVAVHLLSATVAIDFAGQRHVPLDSVSHLGTHGFGKLLPWFQRMGPKLAAFVLVGCEVWAQGT